MAQFLDSRFWSRHPLGRRFACQWTVRVVLVGLAAQTALPMSAVAQEVNSPSESRAQPAPWRPAFGSTNQSSTNQSSTNQSSVNQVGPGPGETDVTRTPFNTPEANQTNQQASGAQIQANTLGLASQGVGPNPQSRDPNRPTSPPGANLSPGDGPGVTIVTQRLDKLPNSAGQVWREYDITPYTSQITTSDAPQQAIIDWITRETGTEMWFNQPLGILSANRNQLYVYHTPEIQDVVKRIVDRFVRTRGQLQKIDVTLMTIENPNWRSTSYTMLQPIEVRSPGVEAWMVSKENAAILQGQLTRRPDAKQSSSGTLTNHDGQAFELKKKSPVQFVSSLRWVPNQIPNYQPLMTKIDEGYSLSLSCLSGLDNLTIEATIKCDVDQVEKLNNIKVNVPGVDGSSQQMNLQIPQLVSWRLHERFRWPNDQVLLLSCGVVANLDPATGGGITLLGMGTKNKRADALLFIEYRGPATEATIPRAADSSLAPIRPRR